MVITIHQPNYMPWAGFFHRLCLSEKYLIFDNAQYIQGAVINRNKIRTSDGWQWLTVPVLAKGKLTQTISDARINNQEKWAKRQWNALQMFYGKAAYFESYRGDLKRLLIETRWEYLADLNVAVIKWLLDALGIAIEMIDASSIPDSGQTDDKNLRLITMCKAVGADMLLTGFGSDYFDDEQFLSQGIKRVGLKYSCPSYPQRYEPFIPNLSAIDLLLNCGPGSREILEKGNPQSAEEALQAFG